MGVVACRRWRWRSWMPSVVGLLKQRSRAPSRGRAEGGSRRYSGRVGRGRAGTAGVGHRPPAGRQGTGPRGRARHTHARAEGTAPATGQAGRHRQRRPRRSRRCRCGVWGSPGRRCRWTTSAFCGPGPASSRAADLPGEWLSCSAWTWCRRGRRYCGRQRNAWSRAAGRARAGFTLAEGRLVRAVDVSN